MLLLRLLDRCVERTIASVRWLALPLVLLLFLQWPLRDLVHGYSREANDLGQVVFAIFVAVSVTAATRAGTHLAADALAQRYSPRLRQRIRRARSSALPLGRCSSCGRAAPRSRPRCLFSNVSPTRRTPAIS